MDKPRIIVSLMASDQDFQAAQAADATSAAARGGVDLDLVFAKNNARLQAEQLYHHINAAAGARPAAIVVQTVAGDGLPRVARDAAKAGIGWVLLNRAVDYIEALRNEFGSLPIGGVTVDQIGIGQIQGRQFRALLPREGVALYIQGPPDTSAARDRLQGVRETVQNAGIELTLLRAEWTEASSERAVTSWLQLCSSLDHAPDLVGAQNDAMAIGARKALASARPPLLNRPFTGCDGLHDGGQRLVREKQLTATVIVPPTAGAGVILVATHLRTGTPIPVRTVVQPRPFPADPSELAPSSLRIGTTVR